jgi:hypothetical protein
MKTLLFLISLALLGGCAYQPVVSEPVYGVRMAPPADPGQWHVVSVTPVAPGTGERLAATSGSAVQYSSEPLIAETPLYVARPVYYPQPVYLAQPVYAPAPYYYPPVSIGFDFGFGRSWGGHRRNWAGVGVGTRWPR